jgi:CubicO group peptidase (beta-lactamase class C family)
MLMGLASLSARAQGSVKPPADEADRARWQAAADYSASHDGQAFLVMKDGVVVFEKYAKGWDGTKPHPLASGSKSFWGVLAAAAAQDGLISLDEKASDTIDEWKSDPRKTRITVRQLLSLSSGIVPGGATFLRALRRNDAKEAIEQPTYAEPGEKFRYGPAAYFVFGEMLSRKLKAKDDRDPTPQGYLQRRVLEPIGIRIDRWGKDLSGHVNMPGGASMSAMEWAKFGEFIRLDGAVVEAGKRKQIVDAGMLKECFKPSHANAHYGLTWWLPAGDPNAASAMVDDAEEGDAVTRRLTRQMDRSGRKISEHGPIPEIRMAAGLGTQRLYVVPEMKLVVVRFAPLMTKGDTGSNGKASIFDDGEMLRLLLAPQDGKEPAKP